MSDLRVATAARRKPEHPALVWDEGSLSFEALAAEVQRLSAPGSRGERAILTPQPDLESVLRLLATLEVGACPALLHPRWSEAEREAAIEALPAPGEPGEIVVFTSGSTGRPRPVRLSPRALCAAAAAHAAALPWEPDDRWLLAMPLAHVGGLSVLMRCLWACATVVLGSPRDVAPSIAAHRVTLASLVPTQLTRLLDRGAEPGSLRAALIGGAACPPSLLARGRAAGWPLLPTYGLSEACAQVCTQRLGSERASGVGPPLPGLSVEIRANRIRVSGPTLASEIGPWLDTGDRGALGEDGELQVLGRLDDCIVTGGENVDPIEVEAALLEHPGVRAAVVFGLPDPEWGERVAAALVGSETDLGSHLEARLASFKRPRSIRWIEALPELPNGKVDRSAARALWNE